MISSARAGFDVARSARAGAVMGCPLAPRFTRRCRVARPADDGGTAECIDLRVSSRQLAKFCLMSTNGYGKRAEMSREGFASARARVYAHQTTEPGRSR